MKVKDNIIISVELIVDEPKSDFNFMRLSWSWNVVMKSKELVFRMNEMSQHWFWSCVRIHSSCQDKWIFSWRILIKIDTSCSMISCSSLCHNKRVLK
jgi:hypothetical protein